MRKSVWTLLYIYGKCCFNYFIQKQCSPTHRKHWKKYKTTVSSETTACHMFCRFKDNDGSSFDENLWLKSKGLEKFCSKLNVDSMLILLLVPVRLNKELKALVNDVLKTQFDEDSCPNSRIVSFSSRNCLSRHRKTLSQNVPIKKAKVIFVYTRLSLCIYFNCRAHNRWHVVKEETKELPSFLPKYMARSTDCPCSFDLWTVLT